MDVFIKSLNRPYYLARCIHSLRKHLSGPFSIRILDDGTPEKYLEKIIAVFPDVSISRSDYYDLKSKAIRDHIENGFAYNVRKLPVEFWRREIALGSENFLLLEEDAWFTKTLDLNEALRALNEKRLTSLKLFWCRNHYIVRGRKTRITNQIELFEPMPPFQSPLLAGTFLNPSFRISQILKRSDFLTKRLILPYYGIYTVSSAIFNRNYWLNVWADAGDYIAEEKQLLAALRWKKNHPEDTYGKTTDEVVNTSYITSSTNPFKTVRCDMIRLNYFLNEAWYQGHLNSQHNLPNDYGKEYLSQFIPPQKVKPEEWDHWIDFFQQQFIRQGCVIH